jgi:hypothetical protein
MFPFPKVQDAFTEDGSPLTAAYESRSGKILDNFSWYARALKQARDHDRDRQRSDCDAQRLVAPNP